MKMNTTIVLGIALAVAGGLFSSTVFGLIGTNTDTQSSASATGLFTGHVTTTLRDADGNIKAYRQSDNIIVDIGENCVSKLVFGGSGGDTTGATVCVGTNDAGFSTVQIGNGSATAVGTDTRLANSHNSTSFGATSSLNLKQGSVTFTNSSTNAPQATAKVVISATFTNDKPSGSVTVQESGLFNSTSAPTNALFARQTFSTITLNANDSLTVQWTVNIGGTTTFN